MLKDLLQTGNTEKVNKNEPKTTMGSHLSITALIVNGLNAPTKRERLAEWIKKQDPIYAVYKRPTSNPGTHTD